MHPDHIGGPLAEVGAVAFPNADIAIQRMELRYWKSEVEQAKAPDYAKPWFDAARAVQAAYGERPRAVDGELNVAGFTSVPLEGHRPGHQGLVFESAGDWILFAAGRDMLIAISHVSFPGVGRAVPEGNGFRYYPSHWSFDYDTVELPLLKWSDVMIQRDDPPSIERSNAVDRQFIGGTANVSYISEIERIAVLTGGFKGGAYARVISDRRSVGNGRTEFDMEHLFVHEDGSTISTKTIFQLDHAKFGVRGP